MGVQESTKRGEDTGRLRERVDRHREESTPTETEDRQPTESLDAGHGRTVHRSTDMDASECNTGATEGFSPGTVAYDAGPAVGRLSKQYGIDFPKAGQARKVQRLIATHGEVTVQRWAEEGMTVDTMGKPRDMEAFRERQAARPAAVPADIERQNQASLQRNARGETDQGPAGDPGAPDAVRQVISRPGRSMDEAVQREMESKMGGDFSDVQLHTGPEAAAAAESINARAFTVGNHVAFNDGEYDPGSKSGKKVLAHELTHVRQQTDGRVSLLPKAGAEHSGKADWMDVQPKLKVSSPDDPAEKEAERVAAAVVDMDEAGTEAKERQTLCGQVDTTGADTARCKVQRSASEESDEDDLETYEFEPDEELREELTERSIEATEEEVGSELEELPGFGFQANSVFVTRGDISLSDLNSNVDRGVGASGEKRIHVIGSQESKRPSIWVPIQLGWRAGSDPASMLQLHAGIEAVIRNMGSVQVRTGGMGGIDWPDDGDPSLVGGPTIGGGIRIGGRGYMDGNTRGDGYLELSLDRAFSVTSGHEDRNMFMISWGYNIRRLEGDD